MNAPPQPARPAERQARDRPRDLAAEDRMNRLAVIMLNHRVVKFALIIVGGFLLGLLLGLMSTTLIFTLLPERMIENGLRDRRGRIEALLKGRPEHCVVRSISGLLPPLCLSFFLHEDGFAALGGRRMQT